MRFSCFQSPIIALVFVCCHPVTAAEKPLRRIAFGSCVDQDKPQPIWEALCKWRPELFLLIGDNIYGDSTDADVLRAKYAKLGAAPGYKKLTALCPVLAAWDDHDYGINDGGAEHPRKAEAQAAFLDFFGVAADSPRRKREGIYDARIFGPPGKRVQIILLDTRYFRSKLAHVPKNQRHNGPYGPNDDPAATMLGDAQWHWLAEQLREPAEVRVIASSIQVIAEGHGYEKWANFPRERRRLFRTIGESGAKCIVFISGDRHLAEIARIDSDESGAGTDLFDLTSSSLNRPGGGNASETNRHRIGDNYRRENFGTIQIDWTDADPKFSLAIHDLQGEIVRLQAIGRQ